MSAGAASVEEDIKEKIGRAESFTTVETALGCECAIEAPINITNERKHEGKEEHMEQVLEN